MDKIKDFHKNFLKIFLFKFGNIIRNYGSNCSIMGFMVKLIQIPNTLNEFWEVLFMEFFERF